MKKINKIGWFLLMVPVSGFDFCQKRLQNKHVHFRFQNSKPYQLGHLLCQLGDIGMPQKHLRTAPLQLPLALRDSPVPRIKYEYQQTLQKHPTFRGRSIGFVKFSSG